ncbi:SGNH/GDSL hydrolase family protein [Microbacterium sp. Kw_RZR3]|uniref:SGNH/GDSL hydrolase family protein n=1 Tax=Microbacterium sp. Kw_RZR3 TaxID=3032903 RepID=UPI0023DBCC9B|nr:SGNH/GDSL hydrolase family protein [Microbacterium sp. Kw_RZR3]MDF2047259.1 SGNH/GDSL hydrolase family protein [Microbacterium sp. Kw_RZR3]
MTRRAWTIAASLGGGAAVVAAALVLSQGATPDAMPSASATSPSVTPTRTSSPRPSPSVTPTSSPTPSTSTSGLLRIPRDAKGNARLLITGDSLAAGFFASTEAQGFSSLVTGALGRVTPTTVSRAHQTLSTVAGVTEVPPDLDLAVIELGTNDVGIPTPLADFEAQYGDLLGRIRTSSPDAALVCLGTWTADGAAYDETIARVCAANAGRYVSLAGLFALPELHGPDGRDTFAGPGDDFHPNDAGHRAIADAVLGVLAR